MHQPTLDRHPETFNNCRSVENRTGKRKGNNSHNPNKSAFFSRKSSFVRCLGGMTLPQSTACNMANTLHAGQALSFATSEAALMPIKAVKMQTEILLLNCCFILLNILKQTCFYQMVDVTFDSYAKQS